MNGIKDAVLAEAVEVDPERMGGVACFAGTRVPIEFLFDWLADGSTLAYFLEQYPGVDGRHAKAVLEWSKLELCREAGALETFAG